MSGGVEDRANAGFEEDQEDVTIFLCGPSKCEHDYSKYEPIIDLTTGKVVGGTAVCAKCGTAAIDEAMWL